MKPTEIKSHEEKCPFEVIGCTHEGCPERVQRQTLELHLSHCPFRLVACKFSNIGCDAQVQVRDSCVTCWLCLTFIVQAQQMDAHIRDQTAAHLDLLLEVTRNQEALSAVPTTRFIELAAAQWWRDEKDGAVYSTEALWLGRRWKLSVEKGKDSVGVYLRIDDGEPVTVSARFRIKNLAGTGGNDYTRDLPPTRFSRTSASRGFESFIPLDELYRSSKTSRYIAGDNHTVLFGCEIIESDFPWSLSCWKIGDKVDGPCFLDLTLFRRFVR